MGAVCSMSDTDEIFILCETGQYEAVEALGPSAIEKDAVFKDGWTLLHAAIEGGNLKLIKYLVAKGLDINKCDMNNTSPFYFACMKGNVDIVEYLASLSGINKEILYKNGHSAFYSACVKGKDDVVRYLLTTNVNKEFQTKDGTTAFDAVCYKGNLPMVKILANKVNMNTCDNDGRSAFFCACWQGHKDVVDYLLTLDIDVEKTSNKGRKPLDIAKEKKHTHIVSSINSHKKTEKQKAKSPNSVTEKKTVNLSPENEKRLSLTKDIDVDIMKEILLHSVDINKLRFKDRPKSKIIWTDSDMQTLYLGKPRDYDPVKQQREKKTWKAKLTKGGVHAIEFSEITSVITDFKDPLPDASNLKYAIEKEYIKDVRKCISISTSNEIFEFEVVSNDKHEALVNGLLQFMQKKDVVTAYPIDVAGQRLK